MLAMHCAWLTGSCQQSSINWQWQGLLSVTQSPSLTSNITDSTRYDTNKALQRPLSAERLPINPACFEALAVTAGRKSFTTHNWCQWSIRDIRIYTPCTEKRCHFIFSTITHRFLSRFLNFCTIGNKNEYSKSHVIYLLNSFMTS